MSFEGKQPVTRSARYFRAPMAMLVLAAALLGRPVCAEVYRWVDEQGNVHFSDSAAAPAGKKYEPPAANVIRSDIESAAAYFREQRKAREAQQAQKAAADQAAAQRQAACEQARQRKTFLEQHPAHRLRLPTDDGPVQMTPDQWDKRMSDTRAVIEQACG